MMLILSSIFIFIWTIFCVYVGFPKLSKMLGGVTILYLILPIIALVSLKYKKLAQLLWGIVLTLVSLIAINYLYSYFSNYAKEINFFTRIYIVWIPAVSVLVGFTLTLNSLLRTSPRDDSKTGDESIALKNFFLFFIMILTTPLLVVIPYLQLRTLGNINAIGYQFALGALILGGSIFLLQTRKIPVETLDHFAKPVHRFHTNTRKIRRIIAIGALIFLILSAANELKYRDAWLIWTESVILIGIYTLFLYKFGQICFRPIASHNDVLVRLYLPSIRDRKNMIIIGFLSVLLIFSLFLAAILNQV